MPALSQSLIFHVNNGNTTTNTVVVDYPNTGTTTMSFVSDKVKGEGYWTGGDGLHTISYTASRWFVGTITTQATLASEPIEADWFDVKDTTISYRSYDNRNTSTVDIYNFYGNFVWIRGHIEIEEGTVSVIQYNH